MRWLPHRLDEIRQRYRGIDLRHLTRSSFNLIVVSEQKRLMDAYCEEGERSYIKAVKPRPTTALYLRTDDTTALRARARLRLGVARTRQYLYGISRAQSPNCESCGWTDDDTHVLFSCDELSQERLNCITALAALTPPASFDIHAVLGVESEEPGRPPPAHATAVLHITGIFLKQLALKKRI